ncbi:MAG: hypothetical protein JW741_01110 [Sedimentisphaerales bacterium]|nr:hypothetical protein [Sedimentisphaerales bacterium]
MSETNGGTSNAEVLTRIMDDTLLNTQLSPQAPFSFLQAVADRASKEGAMWDADVVFTHWSWLQRVGIVVLTGVRGGAVQNLPSGVERIEALYLTARGRRLLENGEASPHNPVLFCARIRDGVKSPDEVVMTYVDEAVGAWAAGLSRAASVMIGCACERLILLLAQSLSESSAHPWSEKLKKELDKAAKSPVSISATFRKVREALLDLAGNKELPGSVADALDRKLTPIFEYARGLRNKSGHPTAVEVSYEDAEAALLLFPGFYSFVDQAIKALAEMGTGDSGPVEEKHG